MTDPTFGTLRLAAGRPLSVPLSPTPVAVHDWLAAHAVELGLDDPRHELAFRRMNAPDRLTGAIYLEFDRVHHGLDVVDGGLTVLLDARHRVVRLTGHYPPSFSAELTPKLDQFTALAIGRRFARRPRAADALATPDVSLVLYPDRGARLAYRVDQAFDRPNDIPYVASTYVDASDGRVLSERTGIYTDLMAADCQGNIWSGEEVDLNCAQHQNGQRLLVDMASIPDPNAGIATLSQQNRTQGNPAQIQADADGNIAHVNAASGHDAIVLSYEYMREGFGRQSWNKGGAPLGQVNLVDYGTNYPNAFATVIKASGKDVSLSAFGNGNGTSLTETTRCLDVAGHELFHNVVKASAGLVYANESGALNEHFADAFGVAIDYAYEDEDDIVGENCTPDGSGIRNMANPMLKMQPDHMRMFRRLPNTKAGDNGGVHINSGIPNKAFYLVYSDPDLGMEAAEQIWYRALDQGGLMSRSQFQDFSNAIITSCENLADAQTCELVEDHLASVGLYVSLPARGGACPANSVEMGEDCVCNDGFEFGPEGDSCVQIPVQSCPENSVQAGDYCYCDDGFVLTPDESACEPIRTAACPANSHRLGDRCVCDDGFFGDPEAPDADCVAGGMSSNCSALEREENGQCVCLPGFERSGNDCVPATAGGCGSESFYGRCSGATLIYCNDPDPAAGVVEVIDCAAQSMGCGVNDAEDTNDCIGQVDPCGSVTELGTCQNAVLTFCDGQGADRAVFEIDCSQYGETCAVTDSLADCTGKGASDPKKIEDMMNNNNGDGGGGCTAVAIGPGIQSLWLLALLGALEWTRRRSRPRKRRT